MTEHTVDWRCARSVPRSGNACATRWTRRSATSPCRPRSRAATTGEADGHAERHVTGRRRHGERHRRPALPLRQRRRSRALRAGERRRLGKRRALGARQGQRADGEVDADRPEAGEDVGTEQAVGLTLPAHLGQCGRRELLRRQGHAVERPRAHRDGPGGAGAPDAGEFGGGPSGRPGAAGGPARRQWSTDPLPCRG